MAWSIGLHLGESVIELTGRSSQTPAIPLLKHRTFITQGSPGLAINQFCAKHDITEISQVQIVTNLPLKILDANHGSSLAVLTTLGFENWLELSLPLKTQYFTTLPEKASFILDRELIFGLNERTNASGHIEKLVDDAELEFLVSKLNLHQIKSVAVCFLHSNRNPENEKRVAHYLMANGFQVFLSSTHTCQDEKSRFWSAITNAYTQKYFHEILNSLSVELQKVLTADGSVTIGNYKLSDVLSNKVAPLETAFLFSDYIASQFACTTPLLYCGIEDLMFFSGTGVKASEFSTPMGKLAVPHWPFEKMKLQPLTRLGRGFFSELTFTPEKISFDPGPMLFGRGLIPTLFDLLLANEESDPIMGINEKLQDRGRLRLQETLAAYARNFAEPTHMNSTALAQKLLSMAGESWLDNIYDALPTLDISHLTLCGPLANYMQKHVGGKVIGDDFFITTSLLKVDQSKVDQ